MLQLRSLPLGPPRASRSTVKDKQTLYVSYLTLASRDDYVENAAVWLNVPCYLGIAQAL